MKKVFGNYTLRDVLIDLVYTVVGTALVGFALSMFTVPNDIAPGGVSGLATALAYITPIRVSAWTLMMNIPLMIAAWRKLGPRAIFYTLIATLLLSFFIEIGERFLPKYSSDTLVASLMGGVVSGLGMGMLFIRGISTGGTDLLALILKKLLPNLPTGTLLMFVDATVVVIATLIFRDFDVPRLDADPRFRRLYRRGQADRHDRDPPQRGRADPAAYPSDRPEVLFLRDGLHRGPRRGLPRRLVLSFQLLVFRGRRLRSFACQN